ncbi:hypothetical protein [Mesomycoplasma neurolyticum]|uniref:Uncharacterized protein n=1 Tax=Mesomycoplasma neurolyticum TaxID=2120 RepID=A0A449A591_9BACT|nr:hypothetical protein [Mesomycoplasma neurolyticum]VEU59384.1 Uncharacterised protein [Mesomycoplasma neurolyticum]
MNLDLDFISEEIKNFNDLQIQINRLKININDDNIKMINTLIEKSFIKIDGWSKVQNNIKNSNGLFEIEVLYDLNVEQKAFFVKISKKQKHNDHYHYLEWIQFGIYFKN